MYLPMCISRRYEQHQSTLYVGSRLYYLNSAHPKKTTKKQLINLILSLADTVLGDSKYLGIPHSKVPVQLPVVQH